MDRKKIIAKNSLTGLISQIITLFFTFLTRTLFIQLIGIELLSINSTFLSIAGAISLAELGFQTAVIFCLYKPLYDDNKEEINEIVNIYRLVYEGIGWTFTIASILLAPTLKYILKGVEITSTTYLYFFLQMAASALSYFFAYKRALLCADQKNYIAQVSDMTINLLCGILQCIGLIVFRSYVLYLLIKIFQTFFSNMVVHLYCRKQYPYLKKTKFNREKFTVIWENVKNVFVGRIAGYIYKSTDNLIISAFISTIGVGYLVNYKTIFDSLNTLAISFLNPITPIIGNYLIQEENSENRETVLLMYTHVRYLMALFIIIPAVVLVDDFVSVWIGSDMLLAKSITMLIAIDFYISLVHSATYDFINGAGLFRASKNIEIAGAATNLISSLVLVQFWGMAGVLIGTIISQTVFWVGRSYVAYRDCLHRNRKQYVNYWIRNAGYIVTFVIAFVICSVLYKQVVIHSTLLKFVVGGVMCEVILIIYAVLLFSSLREQKMLTSYIIDFLSRKIGKQ